ncbi:MAG: DUF429 domain-containing protein [Pseudomonadota bacterium]|nr:DUF429 domain-containing protein [Pseudomonadota bacterium]
MAKRKINRPSPREFLIKRFLGLHLGGAKTDNTVVAVLEYYPKHKKVFLSRIHLGLGGKKDKSADLVLHELLTIGESPIDLLSMDAPLSLPKCIICELKCPGYEKCGEPEIKWMWNWFKKHGKQKKPPRQFVPYTQRCTELHVASEYEKAFHPPEALGSNMAPLASRAQFILRRIKVPTIEVYPELSLWRIGQKLDISKSMFNFHKHSVEGESNRLQIIKKIVDSGLVFVYDQDIKVLSQTPAAFDAFICGLTAYIHDIGGSEDRPKGFPKKESWLTFPKENFTF